MKKYCGGCKMEINISLFNKNKNTFDGVQTECRKCKLKRYRESNPINKSKTISLQNELWKPIRNYKKIYMVSNFGRIKSVFRTIKKNDGRIFNYCEKILSPNINKKNGYHSILFGLNGKRFYIHRLVASHFIKDNGKDIVNHIDGNKANNYASNLEWVTHSENLFKAYKTGLRIKHKNQLSI